MGQATSADGTVIGWEEDGSGPPLVLVHGGTADRTRWLPVREALAEDFTLHLVDRRGRGLSQNESAEPYALAHEAEDLRAVLDAIGEPAAVFAHSYGALVTLEAIAAGVRPTGVVLYEPPVPPPGEPIVPPEAFDEVRAAIDADDRDRALTAFFRDVIGLPAAMIDGMKATPIWAARLNAVPTMPREGDAVEAFVLEARHEALREVPTTWLVGSEDTPIARGTRHAHATLGHGDLVVLEGQGHQAIDTAPGRIVDELRQRLHR